MNFLEIVQLVGAPFAVYVAIRVDVAVMKQRIENIEREIWGNRK